MREGHHRAVIAAAIVSLLSLATEALAAPQHQNRRTVATSGPSLLWPLGRPTGVASAKAHPAARQVRYRRAEPASPARRLQSRHAQAPRSLRRLQLAHKRHETRSARVAKLTHQHRRPVAHAHYATVIENGPSQAFIRHSSFARAAALVAEARRYLGTNPTTRARLWCARFMNFVLARTGLPGTGSDAAKSFAYYGHRISGPQYGAIAVLSRKGGGHVGIVTGVDKHGNPILISGNNGRRRVGISVYPKRRVIAYVVPDGRTPDKKRIRQASR
jgi:uncharacterized protein (TIGR02594 family)